MNVSGTSNDDQHPDPQDDQSMAEHGASDSSLYELEFPAPVVTADEGTGPVLVHALEGFADAGQAVAIAAEHLRQSLDSELLATFSGDELIDYRSRRPTMTFSGAEFTGVQMPSLTMHAIRDNAGRPFLLLSGAEPDLRWEQFVAAIRRLCDRLGVSSVVGLNAIPMAVPHTRPSTITAHGSAQHLLGDLPRWGNAMKIPGSASTLLELRLAQHGYDTAGLSVHVPHYLAQAQYPAASSKLVGTLGDVTGLELPTAALDNAATDVRAQIDAEVEGNAEVESVVRALEEQYDAYTDSRAESESLLAADQPLPSGDEIGAELERFLAGHLGDEGSTGDEPDGNDRGDLRGDDSPGDAPRAGE